MDGEHLQVELFDHFADEFLHFRERISLPYVNRFEPFRSSLKLLLLLLLAIQNGGEEMEEGGAVFAAVEGEADLFGGITAEAILHHVHRLGQLCPERHLEGVGGGID